MALTLRRRASTRKAPRPYLLSVRSSRSFILAAICVAVFTDIFLYGIIVPVIPFALSERAGVPQSDVQRWVSVLLAVYGAGLLVASPLAGWFADRSSSRRLPLLIGLVALAGSTVMLCLARSIALLVVGRLLQGLAAAVVWTVGTALLVDTVGQREIGHILGYVSLSMSIGLLMAPLLGGIVYDRAGYYAVYYMAFALIAVDIVLRLVLIEKKIACQWDVDEGGRAAEAQADSEVSTQGSAPVAVDGNRSPELALHPETTAGPCLAAATSTHGPLPAPAPAPSHSKLPPMLTLLASRRLLAALWGCVVLSSLMTAFDSVIPLFVQRVFGWDSVGAGLVFLAITIPALASPLVGWLSDEYGPRWLTVGGFILGIPIWVLLRLVTHNSMGQKVLLCVLLTLIGVSLTLVMPPLMAEIAYVVEAKERERPGRFGSTGAYAQAYGLFIAAFAAGSLIGPIWSGYVEDTAGWGTMSWSLGVFAFAGAVPSAIWTGGLITERNARSGAERAAGKSAILAESREGIGNNV